MSIAFPLPNSNITLPSDTFNGLCLRTPATATIIGTGNVAHWLVFALQKAGIKIQQIYGRDFTSCQKLAETCYAEATDNLSNLESNSDIYIFCIKDDSYKEVIAEIPFQMPMAVLTSGTIPQRVLAPKAQHFGILYPCQSLSRGMDFAQVEVPLCVEGSDELTESILLQTAMQLSDTARIVHEEERQQLHLAAVFANNFTNALYGISSDLLKKANIDFKTLLPLIQNTLKKLETLSPKEAQTGPAKRNDKVVINKQLSLLQDPQHRKIYEILTEEIMRQHLNK